MRASGLAIRAASLFGAAALCSAAESTPGMGFESQDAWSTAPLELPGIMSQCGVSEEDLWCFQRVLDSHWDLKSVSLKELSGGLKIVSGNVKQGSSAGLWRDLPKYPTIATKDVPKDWTGAKALDFQAFSENATGDVITIGVLSDGPETNWKDYYYAQIKLDWTGWRRFSLPLESFQSYEKPAGWDKVGGLYFFAKAFGAKPNPYASLLLDGMELSGSVDASAASCLPPPAKEDLIYKCAYEDKPLPEMNHNYPEKDEPSPCVASSRFISHQTYFRMERDLFKYYPRFNPGFTSFDPDGKPYVYSGDMIQWLGDDGKWRFVSLKPFLVDYAKAQGWKGIFNNWGAQGADNSIRFDKDGDAYVLIQAEQLDADGKRVGWKGRFAMLLHSKDRMKSWTGYKLPAPMSSFEKLDGHNADCLQRPPAIAVADYGYFKNAGRASFLVLPEKLPDGTLRLPEPVKYAEDGIGVNYHSGDGNILATHGDKIFIVYGWCPEAKAYPEIAKELTKDGSALGEKWTLSVVKDTPVAKTLPYIPPEHPGLKQSSFHRIHLAKTSTYPEGFSKNGVPTFVRVYDIPSRKLSDPVFVGCGGTALDNHNWPAIALDGNGIVHVIINGHHNPVVYARSLKPYDISEWSAPEQVMVDTPLPGLSYSSLNCDRSNTLYTIARSSMDTYNDRLVVYRKKEGAPWEPERSLVAPFKRLYYAWYHKVCYDRTRDRLFLSYFAQAKLSFMTRDMYEFMIFQKPEQEKVLCVNVGKPADDKGLIPLYKDPFWDAWTHGAQYQPTASEIATLVSSDGSSTWHLATTEDYAK